VLQLWKEEVRILAVCRYAPLSGRSRTNWRSLWHLYTPQLHCRSADGFVATALGPGGFSSTRVCAI